MKEGIKETTKIANRLNYPTPRLNTETMRWVEALSSCAIEGNGFGKYMCDLWANDKRRFIIELSRFIWEGDNGN